jgi:DNA-binding transcriptional MocR family regulator
MGPTDVLYRHLATTLADQIGTGLYRAGERLPSIRSLCRSFQVSLSTAVQAYAVLEREGWVEARPRSGYFVRPRGGGQASEPRTSRPQMIAREIAVADLSLDILKDARSPELLNLGAAWPDPALLPLKALAREQSALARQCPELLGSYELAAGNSELRRQIARHLHRSGCRCGPEEIIVTNGCMEALSLSLSAVAKPGDVIVIESPTFYGVLQAIEAAKMRALEVPTHPRDGIDLDRLEQVLRRERVAACLLIPSFNNPLGSCMPLSHRERVAQLLESANVPLIEDDVFGELSFRVPRLPAVKSFDTTGNVLLCSSFTKTLGPGLRVGYVAAGRFAERIEHAKLLANIATAGLPQATVANYLQRGAYEQSLRRASRVYQRRSERLREWLLSELPDGTRITHPQGGLVLWVELPPHISGNRLHAAASKEGVSVTPGIIFSPSGDYGHHLRISYGLADETVLKEGVERLGRVARRVASGTALAGS